MSLALLLEMASSGHGERVALGKSAAGLTFADLASWSASGATVITGHDPRHVVFIGRNGPVFPLLLFAAALAGRPFAPLNYRLSQDQLLELLGELERPLVVADADYLPLVAADHDTLSTENFLALGRTADLIDPVAVDENLAAVVLFTSGTTSRPKAVVLRHGNLVSYILSTVEFGGATPDEAALVSVPPYHIAAVGSVLSNLYAGRRVVYLPDFDAATWLSLVRDEGITSAMVVPTMLSRIVDLLGETPSDVSSLRQISYGGARMPPRVLHKALNTFPTTGFCNAYGLTETSSTVALLGPDEHRDAIRSADPAIRNRLASVGRPIPGIEVQIRDADEQVVTFGITGELWVRGAQVSGEYLGQGSALDAAGWFRTRDRAWQDQDGYLYIEGRTDDTIIRGGENIAPTEIEDVLQHHPAVRDVAVVGMPDDEWGEKIVAVVVRDDGAEVTGDELRAYVRERLRGSRTPDEIVWRLELPHNATGKLQRRQLVDDLSGRPG